MYLFYCQRCSSLPIFVHMFLQGYIFMKIEMLSTQQMLNECLLEEYTVLSVMNTPKYNVTTFLCEHLKSLVLCLITCLASQKTKIWCNLLYKVREKNISSQSSSETFLNFAPFSVEMINHFSMLVLRSPSKCTSWPFENPNRDLPQE